MALFPRTVWAPARAKPELAGAAIDSFEAAGAAEASVGTATSDSAMTVDVTILETLISTYSPLTILA